MYETTSPLWSNHSTWKPKVRNIERAIYKSQRNINSVEIAKSKAPKPPNIPKGKTDLIDQEETKIVPLEQAVPDRKVIIGAKLSTEEESQLIETLAKNKDIFACLASDLPRVSQDTIQHALDINPKIKPRKQQQRKMSEDKILVAKAEVQRLLDANVIREVKYLEWLANVVLVPKKNEKMRMCIDFTYLNKACKKDLSSPRLLLRVPPDLVKKEDEEKTSFTTPIGTYCYTKMPKGIKNTGATFARMTKKVLGPQLQRNIIAYVDEQKQGRPHRRRQ